MSIDTASMASAVPSGSSSKNALRVSVSLPGLPQMILPVSWSDTKVKYRWCVRQEISSTPMSTSPHSRSGSSTSATTRSQIAPTVRHEVRAKPATVVLSVLVTSHATRSSKSRVWPDPSRANGTPSVRTPCSGQRSRLRRNTIRQTRPAMSRCRHDESTSRVS